MVDNPDYKGAWAQLKIPNPAYEYDPTMYAVCKDECTQVGFEIWQVKAGTIFDDIIITDSLEEAQKFAEDTFFKKKDGEKAMFDEIQKANAPADDEMPPMDMGGMDMGDFSLDDDDDDFDAMGDEF